MIEIKESLAVKYRPTTLKGIVGNKTPLSTLTGYLLRGQLPRSFMLSGEPGCGKTSTARTIASLVNCENIASRIKNGIPEPCGECTSCKLALSGKHPDVTEIDCGLDGGKGKVVELSNLLKLRPRYNTRVIIIDEAHNLSGAAKEALLKSLEEPPRNFVWILCSTEPEKFSPAILSRCVKLYFEYPTVKEMANRLYSISKKEFSPEIVSLLKPYLIRICESTRAQPRESITVLDTLVSILSANPSLSKKELEDLLEKVILSLGDITSFSIKFITYLMMNKFSYPLSILENVEPPRINEFITLTSRHAHYMSYYYIALKIDKEEKLRRKRFYGINFVRFDTALDSLWNKLVTVKKLKPMEIVSNATHLSSSLIESVEYIRRGLITPEQALVKCINSYMNYTINKVG